MTENGPSLAMPDGSPVEIDWAAELALRTRSLRLVILARVRDRHAADEVMQEVGAGGRGPEGTGARPPSGWGPG